MNPLSLREICAKATPGPLSFPRNPDYLTLATLQKRTLAEHEGYSRTNDGNWIIVAGEGDDRKQFAQATFQGTAKRGQAYQAPDPEGQANAALIARLSPATALAVYEALENSERVLRGAALTIEDFSPYKAESAARKAVLEQADKVKAALQLLDGRTEP